MTDSHNGSNSKQQVNTRTTALERTAAYATGGGDLNAFYWYQIFAIASALVKVQEMFSSHGTIAMYHHGETL